MIRQRLIVLFVLCLAASVAAQDRKEKSVTFRTSDGVTLHLLEAGAGRAIVFIPGWTMTADIFEPQISTLSSKYHVIAIDPRSHGDSGKPSEGNDLARHAADIKEVIDGLKLTNVVLAGWSNGVADVLSYVARYGTANVGGIVLIDGFVKVNGPDMMTSMNALLQSFQSDRAKFTDRFVRSMYKSKVSDQYIDHVKQQSMKAPMNTAVVEMFNVISKADFTPILGRIDKPALYVCEPFLESQSKLVQQNLPDARIEIMKDAGHALFVDEAEKFNELIASFIDSLHQQ